MYHFYSCNTFQSVGSCHFGISISQTWFSRGQHDVFVAQKSVRHALTTCMPHVCFSRGQHDVFVAQKSVRHAPTMCTPQTWSLSGQHDVFVAQKSVRHAPTTCMPHAWFSRGQHDVFVAQKSVRHDDEFVDFFEKMESAFFVFFLLRIVFQTTQNRLDFQATTLCFE